MVLMSASAAAVLLLGREVETLRGTARLLEMMTAQMVAALA